MTGEVQQFPVEKEYEKNPDISPEDIQKLKEWLMTQPHLPGKYLTDFDLLITYYCCEKSSEVSKQVLDLHYTLRTLFTNYFKDRCFDHRTETSLHTILYAPLPQPTIDGYRAIYLRILDLDLRVFNFNDIITTFMMVFDLWQYEEGTWPGFVLIIDLDKATLGHLMRVEVMSIKHVLYFLQECMLVKLKEVHFLNAPSFMDKIMMLLRPFMMKTLLDMIRIHQIGTDTIYKSIPKSAFPKDLGGDYKDFNTLRDEMIRRLRSNPEFFRDENRRRVNESLRPGGKSNVQDLFGIQGSFKKLDID